MNSLLKFLHVHFPGTLAHIQYKNTSIHTLQPHRYHNYVYTVYMLDTNNKIGVVSIVKCDM